MTIKAARNIVKKRFCDSKIPDYDTWYKQHYKASIFLNTVSFNDIVLNIGDEVISVFGNNLRKSVIENIVEPKEGCGDLPRIKIAGLKKLIRSSNVIKLK